MIVRRRAQRGERGAILVLSAAGMVIALIASALAIDNGRLAQAAREDQKLADMAALDAVRGLPADYQSLAEASAVRNGFPLGTAGYGIRAAEGVKVNGTTCQDVVGAGSACVTVTSPHSNNFPFVGGRNSMTRAGVASKSGLAQFSVGSYVANLDTNDAAALNKVMTAFLGNSSAINLTAVGYQGLAGGTVSLADLVAADPTLGSPNDLLTSSVSVRKLAQATVTALNNKGDAASLAARTPLATFASTINSTLMVKLSDILAVQQPANPGSAAAQAQFNVLDLISGSGQAAVADGTHFVTVPNLTVSVPGLASASLKVTVIEKPRISAFGPAFYDTTTAKWATTAQTAQVAVELNSHITVGNCGFLGTCVDLTMPLTVSAAKATGSLTAVRCPGTSRQADIRVVTQGANATASNNLTLKLVGVDLSPPGLVNTNVAVVGGTTTPDLTFSGPPFPTAVQSTAATGAGLTTATQSKLTLLGIIPLGPVLDLLSPVTAAIDEEILEPVFDAFGLSLGGADVRVMQVDCEVPTLIG
jgi:uncharacterized membrane protein